MIKEDRAEQGVAGYGPQAAAMQWLFLDALAILIARGPSPEP